MGYIFSNLLEGHSKETNFDEFSACSDAKAVFGGVVGVAVIVAPRDMLLMIHMANDRPLASVEMPCTPRSATGAL